MFLQSPKEKQQKLAQQLWEEKQMNEELPGQISSLTLKKHLCTVRIPSWKEIQQLRLQLRILPEVHEDLGIQLHKNCFKRGSNA